MVGYTYAPLSCGFCERSVVDTPLLLSGPKCYICADCIGDAVDVILHKSERASEFCALIESRITEYHEAVRSEHAPGAGKRETAEEKEQV